MQFCGPRDLFFFSQLTLLDWGKHCIVLVHCKWTDRGTYKPSLYTGYGVYHPHYFCLKWWSYHCKDQAKFSFVLCTFYFLPVSSGNLSRKLICSIGFLAGCYFFGWLGSSILHRHIASIASIVIFQCCLFKNAIFSFLSNIQVIRYSAAGWCNFFSAIYQCHTVLFIPHCYVYSLCHILMSSGHGVACLRMQFSPSNIC